jgi:hypothetical protein
VAKPPPAAVEKILKALEPYAVSEELLYLHYSKLDQWSLLDLMKFFGQEDYWRLFTRVRRRLGLRAVRADPQALRHGL